MLKIKFEIGGRSLRRRAGAGCGVLLLLAGTACSDTDEATAAASLQPQPTADTDVSSLPASDSDALDVSIREIIGSVGMPGVQTAVIGEQGLLWSKSYGLAVTAPTRSSLFEPRRMSPTPTLPERAMTNDTVLSLSGVSMQVLAIAFAQQVDAGRLSFDADVNQVLPWSVRNPDFPEVPITWRMILSHTSSLRDPAAAFSDRVVTGRDSDVSAADFARDLYGPDGKHFGPASFLSAVPGTVYELCNFGLMLVVYAIELVTSSPFTDHVEQQIIAPLDMAHTSYFLRDLPESQLAVGYQCYPLNEGFGCETYVEVNEGTALEQQRSFPAYPIAMLRSSADQYVKVLAMLMNGGDAGDATLVQPDSLAQLFQPLSIEASDGLQHALVFQELAQGNSPSAAIRWGSTGTDAGIASAAYFDPAAKLGAVALGNSQDDGYTNRDKMRSIIRILIDAFR